MDVFVTIIEHGSPALRTSTPTVDAMVGGGDIFCKVAKVYSVLEACACRQCRHVNT